MNGRSRSLNGMKGSPTTSTSGNRSQSYRVTRMLIIVSTSFLLLNAPAHICTISFKIYTLRNPITIENFNESYHENSRQFNQTLLPTSTIINNLDVEQSHTIQVSDGQLEWTQLFYIIIIITQHLAYASYSINFFLYSFCGIKFRSELIRCMSKRRRYMPSSRSVTLQNM